MKKNKYGNFPLLKAIENNNTENVKILMKYANKNKIILNINDKNKQKLYLLVIANINNNYDIIKLLVEYSNDHRMELNISKKNCDDITYASLLKNIKKARKEYNVKMNSLNNSRKKKLK